MVAPLSLSTHVTQYSSNHHIMDNYFYAQYTSLRSSPLYPSVQPQSVVIYQPFLISTTAQLEILNVPDTYRFCNAVYIQLV